jgi:hypothetical protein
VTSRTENERIALLNTIVDRIVAEPGLQQPSSIEIRFKQGEAPDQEVTEPQRVAIRSLLMEVRKLDAPGPEGAYLPEMIDIVSGRATDPGWKAGLAKARARYDEWQAQGAPIRIDDGEGPISPRRAFELWAYGEHLHDDPEKDRRMRQMNELIKPHVRQVAYMYMDMLARTALYVREVTRRDPGVIASLKSLR